MRRAVALLGAISLAVSTNAVAAQEVKRTIGEATLTALDVCTLSAFGNKVELGPSRVFHNFPEVVKQRAPDLATLNDVPALIQRFIATAEFSRQFGASQVILLSASDGQVWVVQTREQNLCSIAITGVDNKDGIRQSLLNAIASSEGWSFVVNSSSSNEVRWLENLAARERPNGARASAKVEGLASEFSSPEGIQAELNVRSIPAPTVADSPKKHESN